MRGGVTCMRGVRFQISWDWSVGIERAASWRCITRSTSPRTQRWLDRTTVYKGSILRLSRPS